MDESSVLKLLKGLFSPFSTREFTHTYEHGSIYGKVLIPHGKGSFPVCVFCHGLGGSHEGSLAYAQDLAACGVVCVVFDFCGGSEHSKSSGSTTTMSLMTEVRDLNEILDYVLSWDFVDKEHVWLSGRSQGGAVAAYVAAERQNEIEKLTLLYPAFNIGPALREMFGSPEEVPERSILLDSVEVGSVYALDVWDYDWHESAKAFHKPTLIIHGSKDEIVNPAYSEEAYELYSDAELIRIEGAPHGFTGEYLKTAIQHIQRFLLA